MSYIVILMSFQTISSINYGLFPRCFSVGYDGILYSLEFFSMFDVVDDSLPIPWSGAIIKQLKY